MGACVYRVGWIERTGAILITLEGIGFRANWSSGTVLSNCRSSFYVPDGVSFR